MTICKAHATLARIAVREHADPMVALHSTAALVCTGVLPDCSSVDDLRDQLRQFQGDYRDGLIDAGDYAESIDCVLQELHDQYRAYQWN